MRGSIVKRGNRYSVVVDVGRDENGKRKQRWHSGFTRRKEAERKLAEILGRLESGSYIEPARLTLGEYLTETWLPSIRASVRPSTLTRNRLDVETKLVPALGGVPLQRLTGAQLDGLYGELLDSGLSASSVRHVHVVAHRALRDAVRNDLVQRNVAEAATPPRVARQELHVWSAEQMKMHPSSPRGSKTACTRPGGSSAPPS